MGAGEQIINKQCRNRWVNLWEEMKVNTYLCKIAIIELEKVFATRITDNIKAT